MSFCYGVEFVFGVDIWLSSLLGCVFFYFGFWVFLRALLIFFIFDCCLGCVLFWLVYVGFLIYCCCGFCNCGWVFVLSWLIVEV